MISIRKTLLNSRLPDIYIDIFLELVRQEFPEEFMAQLYESFYWAQAFAPARQPAKADITLRDFTRLIRFVRGAYPELNLGIAYGRKITISSHGALSNLLISAPSIRYVLPYVIKYYAIRMPALSLGINEKAKTVELVYRMRVHLGQTMNEFVIDAVIGSIDRILGYLAAAEDCIRGVELARKRGSQSSDYYLARFKSAAIFDASDNKIILDSGVLRLIGPLFNPELFELAESHCRAELDKLTLLYSLPQRIVSLIFSRPADPWTLRQVANSLNMSPSTLRAKLGKEKTSVHSIVGQVRSELAQQWLANTDIKIEQVAWMLGYSDPSNFTTAFRQWNGVSPSEFRRRDDITALD